MTDPKLEELNQVLEDYRVSRMGKDTPEQIDAVIKSVSSTFERNQKQRKLIEDMERAIDSAIQNTANDILSFESILEISEEVQKGVFEVLSGVGDYKGYHVIPNEGSTEYKDKDLMTNIMGALFDNINS